ncbi:MAG: 30S ribosomal protein S6 [Nitrospirae bacterium]|nr:30S ribosomal protein S6 [Nitrospirota bacterium]
MLIFEPGLAESALEQLTQRISKALTRVEGGRIVREDRWGLRELAYPIRNKEKGYYLLLTHEMETIDLANVRKELRLFEGILRFMTIRLDEKKWKAKQQAGSLRRSPSAPAPSGERSQPQPA